MYDGACSIALISTHFVSSLLTLRSEIFGTFSVSDVIAINQGIFNPAMLPALCDGNNNEVCDKPDIIAAVVEIFSPGNTSTCRQRPLPGP